MYRKLISGILAFVMVFQLCAVTSYATENEDAAKMTEYEDVLETESAAERTELQTEGSDEEILSDYNTEDAVTETERAEKAEGENETETESGEKTEDITETESESETEAKSEADTIVGTETESEEESGTSAGETMESESYTETDTETDAETEIDTEDVSGTESESGTETELETETEGLRMSDDDNGEEIEAVEEGNPDFLFQAGGFKVLNEENGFESEISLFSAGDMDALADTIYAALKSDEPVPINVQEYDFYYNNDEDRKQLLTLYYAVVNDHPELYYVRTSYGISYSESTYKISKITPKYFGDLDDDAFQEGVQKAKSAVSDGMDDLQTAIAVHDYLVLNCEYDKERLANGTMPNESYGAYGALANHIAVCQGYALAYKYLMNEFGIECYVVTSDAMNHAWNIVRIGDALYQLDATWDDPTWDRYGLVSHSYLLQSDAEFQTSSSGHSRHYNWYVTKGSGIVDIKAEGALYDKAFWRSVNSPLAFYDNYCYYIENGNNDIKRRTVRLDGIGDAVTIEENIGSWGGSTAYSGMFVSGKNIIYNTPNEIVRKNLETNETTTVFVLADSSGKIYGSADMGGKIGYVTQITQSASDKATIYVADYALEYTVVFRDFYGRKVTSVIALSGESVSPPLYTPPVGYVLEGWDGNYQNITKNEIVTARCAPKAYHIIYNLSGGTNSPDNPAEYTIESDSFSFAEPVYPQMEGVVFGGWYTDKNYKYKIDSMYKGSIGDLTLYARWTGMWVRGVAEKVYTGSPVAFENVEVYNGIDKLRAGVDYTISYQNNINAAKETDNKAPAIVISGKGNFEGKLTKKFAIGPIDMGTSEDLTVSEMAVVYQKGKTQKPVPSVLYKGTKLVNNKDFTVYYASSPKNPGTYEVIVRGKGNFAGERTTKLTITDNTQKIAMNSVKIATKIPNQEYSPSVRISEDMVTLKYKGETLNPGTDYEFAATQYKGAGTHYVTIRAKGNAYVGEITTSFNIMGTKASQFKVDSVIYTGKTVKPVIKDKDGRQLVEGTDYVINALTGSESTGTAKISITGINAYYGTAAKSFKVKARPVDGSDVTASFVNDGNTQPYEKNGAKPKVVLTYDGHMLTEGTDYSLSYKNNKTIGGTATVTITGKKNFNAKRTLSFTVGTGSLQNTTVTVADKVESRKAGGYVSTPVLKDSNGNKLTAGKDYDKSIIYRSDGRELNKKADKLLAGSVVTVEITGKGNYEGTQTTASYRILAAGKDVSKAKVTVKTKLYYNGSSVILSPNDLTVKIGKATLSVDAYEILPETYINNKKKGTAKVTIRGTGTYGGTKTVSFKIYAQKMEK